MKIVFVILGPSSRCVLILCFFLQFVFFEQHTCGLWGEHMEECSSNTEYCTLVMRQQVIRLTYISIYIYYHILSCTDIIYSNTEYCTLVMRQQVAHLFIWHSRWHSSSSWHSRSNFSYGIPDGNPTHGIIFRAVITSCTLEQPHECLTSLGRGAAPPPLLYKV